MSNIICTTTEELAEVSAALVKKGIQFEASRSNGNWIIQLTGGH
jgi:hypothetical protein